MRLLIVDDNAIILRAFKRILTDFEVETASSARDALVAVDSGRFDAIISDLEMPELDGLWLLEQVRERYPGLRRIICSGGPAKALRQCLSTGLADEAISKPMQRKSIVAALRSRGRSEVF